MKKKLLFILIVVMCHCSGNAQQTKQPAGTNRFTMLVQGGILEGQADNTFAQFQLVGGIQHNAWFYGLGIGADYYANKRSLPIFAAIRKDILNGPRTPFVYADAGYNASWLREREKVNFWGTDYKASGGPFYEAGIGYKFKLAHKMAFGVSAGYSYKQQQEQYNRLVFIDPIFPGTTSDPQPDIFKYQFRRISIKLNCSF